MFRLWRHAWWLLLCAALMACGTDHASSRPEPATSSSEATEPPLVEPGPTPEETVEPDAPTEVEAAPIAENATSNDARRLARDGRHREAVAVLDALLARAPDDARLLSARGYSRLHVEPLDEAATRADLQRAGTLARGDARLASIAEFNLGLLDEALLRGFDARDHFARADGLRSTAASRERLARRCVVDVRRDDGEPGQSTRAWGAIAATFHALVEEAPEGPIDDRAGQRLCSSGACDLAAPLTLAYDAGGIASTGAVVPLADGRSRVVAPLAQGERNIRCDSELEGRVVTTGPRTHIATSGVSTGVTEDGGCDYAEIQYAHAIVDSESGRAIVVRITQVAAGPVRPDAPVQVTTTADGVRIRGCDVDADVAWP